MNVQYESGMLGRIPRSEGHTSGFFVTMAYDLEQRRRMVGHGIAKAYTNLSETWEWTGKAWQRIKASTPTPQVVSPQLSYSPELGGVVLAGGYQHWNGGPSFQETWLYDGKDWSKLPVSLLPMRKTQSAGMMQSLRYDAGRGRMLGLVIDPTRPWHKGSHPRTLYPCARPFQGSPGSLEMRRSETRAKAASLS